MSTRVYVPRDAASLALGADSVAAFLRQAANVEVIRTGSRGLFWLEPMVEVATSDGRIAYGPVSLADIPGLIEAGMLTGGAHPLRLGVPEEIPYLARQTRLTFARCGIVDPLSLDDYRAHGGLKGLARAIEIGPAATIEMVTQSGLRGRGGAGFPTGIKWKTAADAKGERKFIVCNADEGDSGTFADRMLMEGDPFVLIEGMVIAGISVGATKGYVYTRSDTRTRSLPLTRRSTWRGAKVCWARLCSVRRTRSTSSNVWVQVRMSAARRPRCWTAWRASAARCAPSRRFQHTRACSVRRL